MIEILIYLSDNLPQMSLFKKFFILLFAAGTFSSCTTDFDIIAPYEDHTIVYCLLDQAKTTHFVKINKAFLGDGNAFDFASVKDSSEYDEVVGYVEAWSGNILVTTYTLQDTLIQNRDSGLFYYPEQTLYYFNATLNDAYEYHLKLLLNEGEKEVTSSTKLVKVFNYTSPTNTTVFPFTFANALTSSTGDYPDTRIKYITAVDGRQYDMWLQFYYDEYTTSDTTRKKLEWKLDSYEASSLLGGETIEILFNGEQFYEFVASQITSNSGVYKRVFRQVDVQTVCANDDFYTYMKVSAPSTGINQERPSFTNLSNAIGIFASRYTLTVRGKVLNLESQRELCEGAYTGSLLFCSDSGAFAAETFYCP